MMKIIKKSIIVLLLLLFVLSIAPLALADDVNNVDKDDRTLRKKLADKKADFETGKNKVQNLRAKAVHVQDRVDNARGKYSEAKVRYATAKDKYQEKRADLISLKDRAKECGDDCNEKKFMLKKGVKIHLVKTGELIERSIGKLINRLDNAPISDEEKADATETLQALEIKVTKLREKVEAMADDASNEELREAIADLKSTWKEVRQVQKRVVSSLTQAKLSNLVDKHDEYLNGMNLRIDSLKEDGVDTSKLEITRDKFEKHVQQFNLDFAKAEKIWDEAKTGRDVLNELNNAHKRLRDDISKTKRLLHEFIREFRELKEDNRELLEDGE